jgi:hypothetical protein
MFPINDFAKTTLQFAAKTSKFYEKDPWYSKNQQIAQTLATVFFLQKDPSI